MAKKSRKPGAELSADESMILGQFLDFAENGGDDKLAEYIHHVGITPEGISAAGDVQGAILRHYRRRGGKYDIDAAAADLLSWPPIAARVEELRRERRAAM
jgi:hypothetical protein